MIRKKRVKQLILSRKRDLEECDSLNVPADAIEEELRRFGIEIGGDENIVNEILDEIFRPKAK